MFDFFCGYLEAQLRSAQHHIHTREKGNKGAAINQSPCHDVQPVSMMVEAQREMDDGVGRRPHRCVVLGYCSVTSYTTAYKL